MAKNIFIDVSELATWQGKLTGVPRVMDEITSIVSELKEVVFVVWRPQGYLKVEYPFKIENETKQTTPLHIRVLKKAQSKSRIVRKILAFSKKLIINMPAKQDQNVIIDSGDTLLVLADWHGGDPSFIKYLEDAHARGVKLAQVVYDLLPTITPQYSGHSTSMLKNYSIKIYPICDVIFAISKNTKLDIERWLKLHKVNVPKVKVIRLGDDFFKEQPKKITNFTPPERGFVLCVGTIEARKNHTLLYYTYKLGVSKNIVLPTIVIVGRVGWLAEDIYTIIQMDPEVKDKFVFLHNVDDNELAWLYMNCKFSIYPSFYEGWGLPIAESISYGKPVIASDTSSMPEIAGDLIEYFSPYSTEECLDQIVKMQSDKNLSIAKKKIAEYKPTEWSTTADSVINILREL